MDRGKIFLKEVNNTTVNLPKERSEPGAGDKGMNLSLE